MNKIKDLQLNFTEEMRSISIQLITIKQMLRNEKLSKKERKLLQQEFDDLLPIFKDEFQKHNQEQIKFINWYLGK